MQRSLRALVFLGAGMGLMWVLDPVSGRYRRGRIEDRLMHWRVRSRAWLDRASRRERRHERREWSIFGTDLRPELGDFDAGLRARLHKALRSLTRSTDAFSFEVKNGVVTLTGWVHSNDHRPLIETIEAMPGVLQIEDRLHLKEPMERRSREQVKRWWPMIAVIAGTVGALRYTTG